MHAVGSAVKNFHIGERVAGFHEMDTTRGCYAEFAVCPEQTVFHLPDSISDEEAATIPLTAFTAAVGLYRNLDLPAPWSRSDAAAPSTGKVPLVVNAASSAVGAFAVKLAKLNARVGPIIAVAGSSSEFVRTLGVDAVIDYRSSTVPQDIKGALNGMPLNYVFDAANSLSSVQYLSSALKPETGRYVSTMPVKASPMYDAEGKMEKVLKDAKIWYEQIWVGDVHETKKAGGIWFGGAMSRTLEVALAEGKFSGHPYEVVDSGLKGVEAALIALRDRKSGNAKFVTRIADTPGL